MFLPYWPTKLHFCARDKTIQTLRYLPYFWVWETEHGTLLCLPKEIIDSHVVTSIAVNFLRAIQQYTFSLFVCDVVVDVQQ